MNTLLKALLPTVLLFSTVAHAAGKNPPALPMANPSLRAQIKANAQMAGVWQKADKPSLSVKRSSGKAVATVSGLVRGGVAGGTSKFRDKLNSATFKVSITQNGELAKRVGKWKDIQIHRM